MLFLRHVDVQRPGGYCPSHADARMHAAVELLRTMAAMPSTPAQIEVKPPRLYTTAAVLAVVAYGLFLALPVLILSLVVISLPKYGLFTFLIPLLAIAVATFFLPFGFGNPLVSRLVRTLRPAAETGQDRFIVQLTLTPRLRSGLRALMEDADDIGWLSFTSSALVFQGDSVQLCVPFEKIQQLRPQSIGVRGLFVWGPRVALAVSGLPNVTALEFAERSSWLLPSSRRTARELYQCLAQKAAGSEAAPPHRRTRRLKT